MAEVKLKIKYIFNLPLKKAMNKMGQTLVRSAQSIIGGGKLPPVKLSVFRDIGVKVDPSKPDDVDRKGSPALYRTGSLKSSLRALVKGKSISLTSGVPYGYVHQHGGVSRISEAERKKAENKFGYRIKENITINVTPRPYFQFNKKEVRAVTKDLYEEVKKTL